MRSGWFGMRLLATPTHPRNGIKMDTSLLDKIVIWMELPWQPSFRPMPGVWSWKIIDLIRHPLRSRTDAAYRSWKSEKREPKEKQFQFMLSGIPLTLRRRHPNPDLQENTRGKWRPNPLRFLNLKRSANNKKKGGQFVSRNLDLNRSTVGRDEGFLNISTTATNTMTSMMRGRGRGGGEGKGYFRHNKILKLQRRQIKTRLYL